MFFSISLYIALAIFVIGLIYKVSTWLRYSIGPANGEVTPSVRATRAIKGIVAVIFSRKIIDLIRVFIVDGLLQIKVLKQDFLLEDWDIVPRVFLLEVFLLVALVLVQKLVALLVQAMHYLPHKYKVRLLHLSSNQ